jgi:hypothetical protein
MLKNKKNMRLCEQIHREAASFFNNLIGTIKLFIYSHAAEGQPTLPFFVAARCPFASNILYVHMDLAATCSHA